MKCSTWKPLLAAAGFTLVAMGVSAQELKIGYVNSDIVLRDAVPAKQAMARWQAEFSKREKELAEMEARLKAATERFNKELPTLVESEQYRRQRELVDQDREFQRKRRELQEDRTQRRNEDLASVIERAQKAIRQIAEQEKFDLIVTEAIYAAPRIDITDKVIKVLGAPGAK
jgi:outer membrane protein